MMIEALALAMMQPTVAETVQVPTCSLVTPRGDAISFFMWDDPAPGRVRLSGMPGSAWPAGTVVGTRREGQGASRFAIGGRSGLLLELGAQPQGGAQRAATLFALDHDRETLPIAYGFCQDQQITANPLEPGANQEAIGADHAAFDPDLWPDSDCALLLSNGRRIRLDQELQPNGSMRLESADLWSGRPMTTRVRFSSRNGVQVGSFGEPNTPQGVRVLFENRARGAMLFRFQSLNDPALAGTSGYAICGIRRIVRRPSTR